MNLTDAPFVSIVTPVYNGAAYLADCIESVIAQTYTNWEYLIVDNCSTDSTGDIASAYARRDPRICVHKNDTFLDIIANHNHALSLISAQSKYCKIVSADDCVFPDCITQLVQLAEAHPSVGIVGSYQLRGGHDQWVVRCTGLPYWERVISGKDICRRYFLRRMTVFGAPTTNLYRCDLIRAADNFFPNSTAEADVSACIKHLRDVDLGFVHQVLSYERLHEAQVTTRSLSLDAYCTSKIGDLLTYGPEYLTRSECAACLQELVDDYYRHMAIAVVNGRGRSYWTFQKQRQVELGLQLDVFKLSKAVCMKLADMLLNPKVTLGKIWRRISSATGRFGVLHTTSERANG